MKLTKIQKLGVALLILGVVATPVFNFLRDNVFITAELDAWHAYVAKAELGYLLDKILILVKLVGFVFFVWTSTKHIYFRAVFFAAIAIEATQLLIAVFRWFVYDWFAIAWVAFLTIICFAMFRAIQKDQKKTRFT